VSAAVEWGESPGDGSLGKGSLGPAGDSTASWRGRGIFSATVRTERRLGCAGVGLVNRDNLR
jgi:hypothetical protein